MKTDTVRVAVIGAGAIGVHHASGFISHPNAKLVAIAEVSEERRVEACKQFELGADGAYSDYRQILERKDVDVVSVALPNYLHASVGLEALQAGKHVMMEKPIATNAADAVKLADEAERRGLKFMVGQNQRFSPDAQSAKQLILSGGAGEVYHLEAFWIRRSGIPRIGSWFTQKEFAGGGCGYDIGVHMLDLALHLAEDFDPIAVSGKTYAEFGPRGLGEGGWGKSEVDPAKGFDVEDFAYAFIRLRSGRTVSLRAAWACHQEAGSVNNVRVFGTEAGVEVFPFKVHRKLSDRYVTEEPKAEACLVNEKREAHFIDVVLGKAEPFVKPSQSVAVQRILDAMYESSRIGAEVRLD